MAKHSSTKSKDSAVGPLAGYLFQFEKALQLLTELEKSDDYVSIEEVDDVSTHSADGTVIMTLQAKHSIASSGSTFSDTSTALWRTFEIWIDKINRKLLTSNTEFICATNKKIEEGALLKKLIASSFDEAVELIEELLKHQEDKLKQINKDKKEKKEKGPDSGSSIRSTINRIKILLANKDAFKVVHAKLSIEEEEDIQQKFFNRMFISTEKMKDVQRDRIYEEFYGWIIKSSKAKWLNGSQARFTKKNLDDKHFLVFSNPAIVSAVFRTKQSLGSISDVEILSKKHETFVRQIEDIKRNEKAKERIIREAILNFIYADIEIKHVVDKGDFTDDDFEEFLQQCKELWQTTFDREVIKELSEYDDDEKNSIAIRIFDDVMHNLRVEFKDGFCFTTTNMYVKNGCFLMLSNKPLIGWHPEWKQKYK